MSWSRVILSTTKPSVGAVLMPKEGFDLTYAPNGVPALRSWARKLTTFGDSSGLPSVLLLCYSLQLLDHIDLCDDKPRRD